MAGDTKKLKKAAQIMFIEQGKNQKEISAVLGVSENTISKWAKLGKWKEEREARLNSIQKRADDIKEVISNLTERRLEIFKEKKIAQTNGDKELIAILNKEAVGIGDEISKHTKALSVMEKSGKHSLSTYLEIMDSIFKSLDQFDNTIYLKTLDFQEAHINEMAQHLG
ncbi:MAG: helix-turn-helix domain-containing protein [Candidatus Methylacidiphilales bacterium]